MSDFLSGALSRRFNHFPSVKFGDLQNYLELSGGWPVVNGAPDSTPERHLSIASTVKRQSLPTLNAGSWFFFNIL